MSYKKATFMSLAIIVLIGIAYMYAANQIQHSNKTLTLGPSYFPNILGILLIILCIISFIQTWRKADELTNLPNFKYILLTLGCIILFVLAWQFIGYFYIFTFLLLFTLTSLYSLKKEIKKKAWIHGVISLASVGVIYLIFNVVLGIGF